MFVDVIVYVVIVRYSGYVVLERWRHLISWCLHRARFPTRLGMCIEVVVRHSFPRTAIAGLERVRQLLPGGQVYAGKGLTVPMVTPSCRCAWKCISRSHSMLIGEWLCLKGRRGRKACYRNIWLDSRWASIVRQIDRHQGGRRKNCSL